MDIENFSKAMGEINIKYIDEAAICQKKARKYNQAKWAFAAACFATIVIITALLYARLPGRNTDILTLNNGDKVIFVKSGTPGLSYKSLDINVTTKKLAKKETPSLFTGLPVTTYAVYNGDSINSGSTQELIGFVAESGNIKIITSVSDINLFDTVVSGNEEETKVNGTSITAWYFITDKNSQGKRNIIYYAVLKLGSSKVYIENKGAAGKREAIKSELAEVIEKLADNSSMD